MGGERGRGIILDYENYMRASMNVVIIISGIFLLNEKGRSVFVIWELLLWFLSLLSVRL